MSSSLPPANRSGRAAGGGAAEAAAATAGPPVTGIGGTPATAGPPGVVPPIGWRPWLLPRAPRKERLAGPCWEKGVPSLLEAGAAGGLAPAVPCLTIMLQEGGSLLVDPLFTS
jgi:hypothetical protein